MLPIAWIVSLLLAGSPTADKELNTIWVRRAMPTSPVVSRWLVATAGGHWFCPPSANSYYPPF